MKLEQKEIQLWEGQTDYIEIATFTDQEIEKAEREFHLFKDREGKIWDRGINCSRTYLRDFFDLYFGEYECGHFFLPFKAFRGLNEQSTKRIYKLFRALEFFDNISDRFCTLDKINDYFYINNGDW